MSVCGSAFRFWHWSVLLVRAVACFTTSFTRDRVAKTAKNTRAAHKHVNTNISTRVNSGRSQTSTHHPHCCKVLPRHQESQISRACPFTPSPHHEIHFRHLSWLLLLLQLRKPAWRYTKENTMKPPPPSPPTVLVFVNAFTLTMTSIPCWCLLFLLSLLSYFKFKLAFSIMFTALVVSPVVVDKCGGA